MARQRERLFASAERGRPEVGHETWHQVDVRVGRRVLPAAGRPSPAAAATTWSWTASAVDVERRAHRALRAPAHRRRARRSRCCRRRRARDYLVEVDGAVHRISGGEAGLVRAPAPAMVVAIPVVGGRQVTAGDVVAVVESMKLETALRAPFAGRVREVLVAAEHPGRGRHDAAAPGAGRRRRRGRASRRAARRPGRRWPRRHGRGAHVAADRGRRRARPRCATSCSATTSTRRDARAAAAPPCPRPAPHLPDRRPGRARRRARDHADLRRPVGAVAQPARPRGRGAQPSGVPEGDSAERRATRRSTSTPSCAPATPTPRGCPSRSGPGCAPRSPTTACRDLGDARRPGARRRAVPDVPRPPAGRARTCRWCSTCCSGGSRHARTRCPAPDVRERVPARARPPGHRHPGAPPRGRRPRPAGALPLLRRAADRRRAGAGPAAGARRAGPAGRTTDPADRAAQIDDIVAAGRADPRRCSASAHHAVMLEVMTRRYYRIRHLTDVQRRRPRRPAAAARRTYRHDGRDHVVLATTVHTAPAAPARASRPPCRRDLRRIDRASCPTDSTVLLDLYVTAGEAPDADPERSAEKIRALLGHAARDRWTGSRSRCAGPRATSGRAGSPSGPTPEDRRAGRGPHAAWAAPDGGRAAGAVAAGELRR